MKRLFQFETTGYPTYFEEAGPGRFVGVASITPLIFSITSAGTYNIEYTFPPNNQGTEVASISPTVYGPTYGYAGSAGSGTLSELFSLSGGGTFAAYPFPASQGGLVAGPIQYRDGRLFAIAGQIVGNSSVFSLVEVTLAGATSTIYTFAEDEGLPYYAGLLAGLDGNLYGVSLSNSGRNIGIYRLTPAGSFSWVAQLTTSAEQGYYPMALIQASNGNLYGTLPNGGSSQAGSIYEVTLSGTYQTVYQYSNVQIGIPETLLQASDGMLYGTARGLYASGFYGHSSIFRLDPVTNQLTTIYKFDGEKVLYGQCECRMLQGNDGKFYGVGSSGGTFDGGTVFVLDAGLPAPKPTLQALTPSAAAPGKQVLLFGANLLQTTSVSFNGTPATFKVGSVQGVWADVPAGATTGPVTITAANGSFTSTVDFVVQ
jgi:hypothetical protein